MADGLDPKQAKVARAVNLFTIPEHLVEEGIDEIGMITMSADEELAAYKRSGGDTAKLATELVKTCLVEASAGGVPQKLSLADGSVDGFWKKLDPRVRQLVMTAYAELHTAKEEDAKSFTKSRRVRVA